jgi:uncharacterized protein YutE (UPF0331/DUF86 family)
MQVSERETEKQRIEEIAQEYQNKGYKVTVRPGSDELPDFLQGYEPDILAQGPAEAVIVEVKSRLSLAQSQYLRDLARRIEQNPGWRFEIAVINSQEEVFPPENACSLGKDDIVRNLRESSKLAESNHLEAALLMAWSSTEATLRLLADKEKIHLRAYAPQYMIKQLATYAVLSRDEYNMLMRAIRPRNALVHGFKTDELDSSLVEELIETTDHLLQSLTDSSLAQQEILS